MTEMKRGKSKKSILGVVACVIIILAVLCVVMVATSASKNKRVSTQLDLGERYLTELDYEQAIVAYEEAIRIDSKCVEAYLGLAHIYVERGQYDEALEVLESGGLETGAADIMRRIEEVKQEKERAEEIAKDERIEGTGKKVDQEVDSEQGAASNEIPLVNVVSMENYDTWGYSNGGVIPVKKNGLWGAIDYDGNVLVEPIYPIFYSAPNYHGYTIFADDSTFYLHDAAGKLVLKSEEYTTWMGIGEEDVVLFEQAKGVDGNNLGIAPMNTYYTEDVEQVRYIYQYVDGTVIYDSEWQLCDYLYAGASKYHNGRAYCTFYGGMMYEVTPEGIRNNGNNRGLETPIGGCSDGYFVVEIPGNDVRYALCEAGNLELSPVAYFETERIPECEEAVCSLVNLKRHWTNGVRCLNYGKYGVATINCTNTLSKDVLFDYTRTHDTYDYYSCVTEVIAAYDEIILDDFMYLCVHEGDKYFYIDYSGNKVSDDYYRATSFNDRGYAIVMEEEGTAYIINSAFKKLATADNVMDIGFNDDTFAYEDIQENVFLYHYAEE